MKRLFGLIGFTYLSVLAVVFYFYDTTVIIITLLMSASLISAGVVLIIIKKQKDLRYSLIIAGITAFCACLSLILYTNIVYKPVIDNYSNKEIKISGYVCDEIIRHDDSAIYMLDTYAIDGKEAHVKIKLVSYKDLHISEFDKIKAELFTYALDNNSMKSKRVFLATYSDDYLKINKTGEKHFSIYSVAVDFRKALESSIDSLLPEEYASLGKAVFLGEKQSLSYEVQDDFNKTGSSFLIVVSGMHFSIIIAFASFFIRKITSNRFINFFVILLTALSFIALTGFTPSVVRAGTMLIIAYGAAAFLRSADPINSMGIAVILLTIANPFAAGDVGLLLSFLSTMGIVLWARKIYSYLISLFKFKHSIVRYFVNLFSVSLSAFVWVAPISIIVFHKMSPLVIIVSLALSLLVSVLIICTMMAAVLYLCPFISFAAYPFALVSGLISKFTLWFIHTAATLPYASVNTDKPYFYIWLAVTALLVILGYIFRLKSFYIKSSIAISLITLVAGWAIFSFLTVENELMTVYSTGDGISVSISCGSNISVISCGGSSRKAASLCNEIEKDFSAIDNIIIPSDKSKYSRYQEKLVHEFDIGNIFVYDKDSKKQDLLSAYDGCSRFVFGDNSHFSLNISQGITDDVINANGYTFQYIKGGSKSVLLAVGGADISDLPERFRTADYLVIDKIPKNIDLIKSDTIIFSGSTKQYSKVNNDLKKLKCNILNTANENVVIYLN